MNIYFHICINNNLSTDHFRSVFGDHHSVFADALLDKGFFLLNVDSINRSVEVYMVSLLPNFVAAD